MKKALDQTVRTVKREVNKKVLKVPEIERKVLEATCNEPWGPHGTLMADIAQASRNFNDYLMTMSILWKRLNDSGRNWRHVYKSLTVMEFLVAHGADRVIDELREHTYQIQTLVDFQYIDSHGRDQGLNVRKKAQALVSLINDKEKIREVRSKAAANRDKYRGSAIYRASSYSSTAGTYEEDDRYRRDDRYREGDRYRDDDKYDDRYSRDGDRYSRDSRDGDRYRDEDRSGGDRYTRDRYGDNRADGAESRYGYDDARSSGSKDEDDWRRTPKTRPNPPAYEEVASPPEDKSEKPSKPAENGTETQSSFEPKPEAEADGFDDFDPRGKSAPGITSVSTAPPSFMSAVEELFADTTSVPPPSSDANTSFEPSNPFGSSDFRATGSENGVGNSTFQATSDPQQGTGQQPPAFEDALALALVPEYATESPPPQSEAPPPVAPLHHAQSFTAEAPRPPAPLQHAQSFPGEQNFQSFPQAPFPQQTQGGFPQTQQTQGGFPQTQQTQGGFPQTQQTQGGFPQTQQIQGGFPQTQQTQGGGFPQQSFPQTQQTQGGVPQQSFPQTQGGFPQQTQGGFPQQTQASAFVQHPQQAHQHFPQQAAFAAQPQQQVPSFAPQQQFSSGGFHQQQQHFQSFPQPMQPFTPQQQSSQPPQTQASFNNNPQQQQQPQVMTTKAKQQEKFQPKSAVWADTLNLVDLNIGPLKNDPLAELGIQIKESRVAVSQQRKEEKMPTTMGKAMGSGSGLGIAAASIMPPALPPPPPIMNGGMTMVPPGNMVRPPVMMPPHGMMPGMGMMGPPLPMMNHHHGGYPQQQPQYGGYR